jgi:dihydroxyacetone kinase-like predicted kinase
VVVVPTRSPLQALFDRPGDALCAAVAIATRAALTEAGPCEVGQALAIVEGAVTLVADRVVDAAVHAVDRLLAAGAARLVLATGADPGLGDLVARHVASAHPGTRVDVIGGAGPHDALLLAAG